MMRQDLHRLLTWNESSDADLYDEISYTLSYGTDLSDLTDVTSSSGDNYSLSFDGDDDDVDLGQISAIDNHPFSIFFKF